MHEELTGYVAGPGDGVGHDDPGLKASRQSTGGAISVFEATIDAGPPLHVHDHEDECLYVLAGGLRVRCGDETFGAAAGSFVFLPRGRAHRFWADVEPARVLLMAVPGGIEDYFREINAATTEFAGHAVGEKYGIRVVAEPRAEGS